MASENLHPLEELKRLDQQVEEATQLADLKPIFYRLEEIAQQHSADFEVQLVVGDVKQHVVNRGTKLKEQSQPVPEPAPLMPPPPAGKTALEKTAEKPVAPPPPPAPMQGEKKPEPPTVVMPSPLLSAQLDAPGAPASGDKLPDDLRPKRLVSSGQFSPPDQPATRPPAAAPPPVTAPSLNVPPPVVPPAMPPPVTPTAAPRPDAPTVVLRPGAKPAVNAGEPTVFIKPDQKDLPPPATSQRPVPPGGAGTVPPLPPIGGSTGPQKAAPPPNKPPTGAPPPGGGGPNWKRALGIGALAGLLLAAIGVGVVWYLTKRNSPGGGFVSVEIATTPPGAAIRVNGEPNCTSDCTAELPPGTYEIAAFLDGYEPASSEITVEQAGATRSLSLSLTPQPQTVRILADLNQGTVTMDGQQVGTLQDGQFVLERVPPGSHNVTVAGGANEASFSIDLGEARMPAVTGAVNTKDLLAVIVTSFANQARVVTSSGPMKLTVNGEAQGDASPSGVDLANYQAGVAEMVLGEGPQQRTIEESFGTAPMVTAFLKSEANIGTLIVATGQNDVRVFLNDREYPRRTSRGQLRVQTIGRVNVRVAKDGFEDPMPQTVTVTKGSETRVTFTMRELPEFVTLDIAGGTPGAEVLIDGGVIGTLGPASGGLRNSSIEPGAHVIELRRTGFQPKRFERTFRRGQTVSLTGQEATLIAERPEPPPPPPPPAPKPEPPPSKVSQAPKPRTGNIANFDSPEAWRQENGVWRHRGEAHLTYNITPPNGLFTFTIHKLRGGNIFRAGRVRWAVMYNDRRNHAFYEMDDDSFWAKVEQDGKTYERVKVKHGLNSDNAWPVQVDISPQRVIVRVQRDGEWVVLDSWSEPGRDFTSGKFAILVNGNDEVGLTDFRFTGR